MRLSRQHQLSTGERNAMAAIRLGALNAGVAVDTGGHGMPVGRVLNAHSAPKGSYSVARHALSSAKLLLRIVHMRARECSCLYDSTLPHRMLTSFTLIHCAVYGTLVNNIILCDNPWLPHMPLEY